MRKNYIYSNYYDSDREKYTREYLFEEYATEEGWETIDDIPDNRVWEEMNFNDEIEWDDARAEMRNFFEGKTLLVTGYAGTWRGNLAGGAIIGYDELWKCWEHCDYVEIYDEGGHFYINSTHHDGTNSWEIRILTEQGINAYDNWNYGYNRGKWNDLNEREVHEKLAENSKYTHIPHFAREVYGCKTR